MGSLIEKMLTESETRGVVAVQEYAPSMAEEEMAAWLDAA